MIFTISHPMGFTIFTVFTFSRFSGLGGMDGWDGLGVFFFGSQILRLDLL